MGEVNCLLKCNLFHALINNYYGRSKRHEWLMSAFVADAPRREKYPVIDYTVEGDGDK